MGFLSVLPTLVLIGLVVLVVRAMRGDGDRDVDWGGLVLDLFHHVTTIVLAFTAASGLAQLLGLALGGPGLVQVDEALAGPVAFSVLGLPLYAGALWWLLRRLREDRARRASLLWALHLGLVEIVALVVALVATYDLAVWALERDGTWAEPFARVLVWGAVWAGHRVLQQRAGGSRWSMLRVLVGSAIGVGALATGLVQVLDGLVARVVLGDALVVADDATRPLVVVALGVAVWGFYWLGDGVSRDRDMWWYGYVVLGPVLVGLLTAVGSLGYVVYTFATWFLGEPHGDFADHVAEVPSALAVAVVAGLTWFLHDGLLAGRGTRRRMEIDRVHDLILSGVGLLAAAGGVAALVVALVEAVVGPSTAGLGDEPTNTLLGAVTFLVIGAAIWWRPWQRVQRLARRPPSEADRAVVDEQEPGRAERNSPARRVYLFGLFGVGGLVAVGTLLGGVVTLLEEVFGGTFGLETLREVRIELATIVVVGAVAALHWTVWRRDVKLGAHDPTIVAGRRHPRRVTLVGVADDHVVSALRDVTGGRVELWARQDGVMPPWDVQQLSEALVDIGHEHVVVVADRSGSTVIPVRD